MKIALKRRSPLPWWGRILLPIGAVLISVIFSSLLIIWAKGKVAEAWYYIFMGSLGSRFAFLETMVKMTPLIFTGLAVSIAFKAKFWNIGAEGQLYAGAFAAAALGIVPLNIPSYLHILLILIGGFVAGGALAFFPGYLKVKYKVDEIVCTILLNYILIYLLGALLDGPWRDLKSGWPHSPIIHESAKLPILVSRSRFHLGVVLAFMAVAIVYVLMEKTIFGYRIKAIGSNSSAAYFGGIPVYRTILSVSFISGGLAGLAGVCEVCAIQYYLVNDLSPGYGFCGIAVAMLANKNPIGVIFSAFYFAVIITGSQAMSRMTGIPIYLDEILQGIALLAMVLMLLFNRYKVQIKL